MLPPIALIVEDEFLIAQGLRSFLEKAGYRVLPVAESAQRALDRFGDEQPGLVLMDISLRGEADGIEAAHRIRSVYGPETPIVFITGYTDTATRTAIAGIERSALIGKPFKDEELLETITTLINIR